MPQTSSPSDRQHLLRPARELHEPAHATHLRLERRGISQHEQEDRKWT